MKPDIGELMKQAQLMQEKMQRAQADAANTEVTGKSGAGLVTVVMTGRYDVKRVSVDDAVLSEDKEMLEDLLAAAVNDAVKRVEEHNKNAMASLTSGMEMPAGFKMPF
ncbi:MAG: DNA-binding YbaB/EbfC family protein [Halieaceae bacterium]|jgi:DNA-binding YbaB/EbfC family protein